MATHRTTGCLVRWREIFLEAGGLGVHLVVVVLHDLTIVRGLGRCGLGACCCIGLRGGRQAQIDGGRRGHGGRRRRCRFMILHDHRIARWHLVRHGANAWGHHLLLRRQLGWLRRLHGARLAGLIDQTHGQHLIAIDRHHRQMLRLGLHLVPQRQCEQRVQYQDQSQRERRVRQRWLSPASATQGLARFAVE